MRRIRVSILLTVPHFSPGVPGLPGPGAAPAPPLPPLLPPRLLPGVRRQPQPPARVQAAHREQGQDPGEWPHSCVLSDIKPS